MSRRAPVHVEGTDTRGRMLDAALDLITRHGYEGMSLQMVADAIGVTKAAVYYHFRTKADLLDAVLRRMLPRPVVPPNPRVLRSRRARLTWFAEEFLVGITRDRRFISVIDADPVVRRHPTFVELIEGHRQQMLVAVYGPEPTPADRAAYHLATAAVHALPALADLDDTQLIEALRPALYRTLGLPAPPA